MESVKESTNIELNTHKEPNIEPASKYHLVGRSTFAIAVEHQQPERKPPRFLATYRPINAGVADSQPGLASLRLALCIGRLSGLSGHDQSGPGGRLCPDPPQFLFL